MPLILLLSGTTCLGLYFELDKPSDIPVVCVCSVLWFGVKSHENEVIFSYQKLTTCGRVLQYCTTSIIENIKASEYDCETEKCVMMY